MAVSQFGDHTPSGGALDEAFHDEKGLIDLLNGACILAHSGGNRRDTHRTALELVDDGEQDLVVDLVETILVDVQGREGFTRRNRALAIRGVPRERRAISSEASSVMGTPRMPAERSMMVCSVSGS